MKSFKGEVWGGTDRFEENDDGTCHDVLEIYIEAKAEKTLKN